MGCTEPGAHGFREHNSGAGPGTVRPADALDAPPQAAPDSTVRDFEHPTNDLQYVFVAGPVLSHDFGLVGIEQSVQYVGSEGDVIDVPDRSDERFRHDSNGGDEVGEGRGQFGFLNGGDSLVGDQTTQHVKDVRRHEKDVGVLETWARPSQKVADFLSEALIEVTLPGSKAVWRGGGLGRSSICVHRHTIASFRPQDKVGMVDSRYRWHAMWELLQVRESTRSPPGSGGSLPGNDFPPPGGCEAYPDSGLMWEPLSDDPTAHSYREATYTWYQPDGERNGGDPGVYDGGACAYPPCDTQGHVTWTNGFRLCNFSDWRMSTIEELLLLAEQDGRAVTGDEPFYWAAESFEDPAATWGAYLCCGGVPAPSIKSGAGFVRLVRSFVEASPREL